MFRKRMTALFSTWTLIWVLSVAGHAAGGKAQKCFLWRVRSASGIAYLLGSLHVAKRELYPLNQTIEDAFDRSRVLMVEVDVDALDPGRLQSLLLQKARYPEGVTLRMQLGEKTYELAREKLAELGIPIEQVSQIRPAFVALTVASAALQRLGFDPAFGIEKYFLGRARGSKEIIELEGAEHQIDLFGSLSDREHEWFLLYTLLDLQTVERDSQRLIDAWQGGDTEAIERLLTRTLREHPETMPIYEKIFHERNKEMLSKMEVFLRTDATPFIIVGAGHLVGESGIISLLREKGYIVEQLSAAFSRTGDSR